MALKTPPLEVDRVGAGRPSRAGASPRRSKWQETGDQLALRARGRPSAWRARRPGPPARSTVEVNSSITAQLVGLRPDAAPPWPGTARPWTAWRRGAARTGASPARREVSSAHVSWPVRECGKSSIRARADQSNGPAAGRTASRATVALARARGPDDQARRSSRARAAVGDRDHLGRDLDRQLVVEVGRHVEHALDLEHAPGRHRVAQLDDGHGTGGHATATAHAWRTVGVFAEAQPQQVDRPRLGVGHEQSAVGHAARRGGAPVADAAQFGASPWRSAGRRSYHQRPRVQAAPGELCPAARPAGRASRSRSRSPHTSGSGVVRRRHRRGSSCRELAQVGEFLIGEPQRRRSRRRRRARRPARLSSSGTQSPYSVVVADHPLAALRVGLELVRRPAPGSSPAPARRAGACCRTRPRRCGRRR